MKLTVSQLNSLDIEEANHWFMQICTAKAWCEKMVQSRPYEALADISKQAEFHWQKMQDADYLEAFEGHPMIGDVDSLKEKYASTKALAINEQSEVTHADNETIEKLFKANHAYLNKHGFIFIICATGLSATTMLSSLCARLRNSTAQEMKNAANEQLKISLLRINKAINEGTSFND